VAEEDHDERVVQCDNLDLARRNHMVRATEVLLSDVRKDLPEVSVEEWAYDLDPAHKRLYDRLAEERVVVLEGTGKRIDAVSVSSLYHQCQQLVLNWAEYAGNAQLKAKGLELAEQWLDELGGEKLIIVANYRRTNAMLLEALKSYGARLMYGDMTHKQKIEAKDDFINDPKVRVLIMQPEAGGVGIDGLQHVCHSMLFLESPSIARPYTQAVARVDRTGQTNPVQVRIAVAKGTVQAGSYQRLLNNDTLLSHVQLTPATLRQMILGELPSHDDRKHS
jgi:SNF2 family DNA or RNA helicase